MTRRRTGVVLAVTAVTALGLTVTAAAPASADRGWSGRPPGNLPKVPLMVGAGGAVASVDRDASQVGIDILSRGGNAADAAVATAAALGVTEPYSAGIGGGGFLVYYDAKSKKVSTIDGRETAPKTFTPTVFQNADGTAMNFDTVVSSGLSVGTPGTPALWSRAAKEFGRVPFPLLMAPAAALAYRGFTVDQTFYDQTAANADRFRKFPATSKLFLPNNAPPPVGSTFRNPDLARTYLELGLRGTSWVYQGGLGDAVAREAQHPSTAPGVSVMGGQLTKDDLEAYRALDKAPITSRYKGYDVYGMPVPSSGGIAVAETLNLIEAYERQTGKTVGSLDDANYLHWFSEATATAFADRNRYVGDVPNVPVQQLVSQAYADSQACALFSATTAQTRPLPYGDPAAPSACAAGAARQGEPYEGQSTTHLVTADKWGNVASYTLTIEQTGGSGITVPGYGFLLNNELTDFNFTPLSILPPNTDPNLPGPGKRPRSSMSPTIILKGGTPYLSVGSPGGATIITSVGQTILGYLDRGLPLVDAIAAPRLSSRNGVEEAEPAIYNGPLGAALTAKGHVLKLNPEIGAVTAIHPLGNDRFEAAAETTRRGGGSAMVVRPDR